MNCKKNEINSNRRMKKPFKIIKVHFDLLVYLLDTPEILAKRISDFKRIEKFKNKLKQSDNKIREALLKEMDTFNL